ncbi:MAG TPA: aldo/keto reductase [Methylocella sp.]|nr:aldo/keto reductase [Methylocella sp.]
MRTVFVPALGHEVSTLGFGCASLGSLVSESQGLRVLNYAFERGISWYDVAPAYGFGEAEGILGKFLAGRRDRVVLCTKFGDPRPTISPVIRHLRPMLRTLAKMLPPLNAIRRGQRIWRERLHPEQIEASVIESLRRLRTDHIDVLALDDPSPEDCVKEEVLRELQRVLDRGYVRAIGIAGEPEAVLAAAKVPDLYKVAQLADDAFSQTLAGVKRRLASGHPLFFVTHSVFGSGAHERLSHLLVGDGGRLGALASQLAYGPPFMANEMLLDYAFATNPEGVVLTTMSTPSHIDMNCARASRAPRKDIGPFMQKFVLPAGL